jgi:hypothetical protein
VIIVLFTNTHILNSPDDTEKFFDPFIFTPYPVDSYSIPDDASSPHPWHSKFPGPQLSYPGSFNHFVASQSTNAGSFLSWDRNPSTGVDETLFVDRSFSRQWTPEVDRGSIGGSQPVRIVTGAQVHPTLSFDLNCGAQPEGYGTCFSSGIIQSPSGHVTLPGPHAVPAGTYHSTFTDAG